MPADEGRYRRLPFTSVKAAVLPFGRFPGAHQRYSGPEMRSTGEDPEDRRGPGGRPREGDGGRRARPPHRGNGVRERRQQDKRAIVFPAKRLADLGFSLLATTGTAGVLRRAGVPVEAVAKVSESEDNVAELIRSTAFADQHAVRARAQDRPVPHPHRRRGGRRAVPDDAPRRLRGRAGIEALRRA